MSAHRRRGVAHGAALALLAAIALAGCDSNDDDGNGGGSDGPDPEPGEETTSASTFAEVIALGATDDPVALDGEALGANLDSLFGTAGEDPTDIEEELSATDRRMCPAADDGAHAFTDTMCGTANATGRTGAPGG